MSRILVVDDSKMLRDMVVYALNEGGYESVYEAQDGSEGLKMAKSNSYDLVLTDINMPIMNGFELTAALRELDGYKKTPILVLTTEAGDDMKQKGKDAGATGWIVKPFVPDELLQIIEMLLNRG